MLIAGGSRAWTWALVKDIDDGWIRYSQIDAIEAAVPGPDRPEILDHYNGLTGR